MPAILYVKCMEYSGKPDFSIVMPAYNEAENLPVVLGGLKLVLDNSGIASEIIVVDNGSSDGTKNVLEQLKKEIPYLRTVRIENNIGIGNGIINGLEAAQGSVLGFMVADGQVEPKTLVEAYRKLKEENLDLCKGYRINRCDGPKRIIMSRVYNILFSVLFGYRLKDAGGGPKIFTRNFYETIKPETNNYFIDNEILIKAMRNHFKMGEIPVVSLKRKGGKSTVSIFTSFAFFKDMFNWFLFKK